GGGAGGGREGVGRGVWGRLVAAIGEQADELAGDAKATVARTASGSEDTAPAATLTRMVPSGDPAAGGPTQRPSSRARPMVGPDEFDWIELGSWKLPQGGRAVTGRGLVATWDGLTLKTLIVAVVPLLLTRTNTTLPSGCRRKKSSE